MQGFTRGCQVVLNHVMWCKKNSSCAIKFQIVLEWQFSLRYVIYAKASLTAPRNCMLCLNLSCHPKTCQVVLRYVRCPVVLRQDKTIPNLFKFFMIGQFVL